MKHSIKIFIPLFFTALSSISCAGNKPDEARSDHEAIADTQPTRIHLSPETTELLIKEMRELQEGMKKIVPALSAGEWEKIASIGKQMRDSYIMKDSLTEEQMHELHESLPATFQELDHSFHHSAGLLAQAADKQDKEKVSYYYFKMTEACVECHTIYATHKFPEFLKPNNPAN
jgi:hypothetical protein